MVVVCVLMIPYAATAMRVVVVVGYGDGSMYMRLRWRNNSGNCSWPEYGIVGIDGCFVDI